MVSVDSGVRGVVVSVLQIVGATLTSTQVEGSLSFDLFNVEWVLNNIKISSGAGRPRASLYTWPFCLSHKMWRGKEFFDVHVTHHALQF